MERGAEFLNVMLKKLWILIILVIGFEALLATLPSFWATHTAKSIEQSGWFPLINPTTNQFLWWRTDLLLHGIDVGASRLFSQNGLYGTSILLHLGLLFLFLSFIPSFTCVVYSASAILCLRFLYGWDEIIWRSLVWLPWLVLSLRYLYQSNRPLLPFFFVAFFSWRMSQSAQVLAFSLFCIALCCAVAPKIQTTRLGRPNWYHFGFLLGALICSIPLWLSPDVNTQGYPVDAHLVPVQDLAAPLRSLLGPSPKISFIDHVLVRSQLSIFSLFMLAVSIFIVALNRYAKTVYAISLLCLILAALVCLDVHLPANLAAIAPLATLSRILPGLMLTSPALLAVAIWVLTAAFASRRVLMAILLPATLLLLPMGTKEDGKYAGRFIVPANHQLVASIQASDLLPIVFSPSYRPLLEQGLWLAEQRSTLKDLSFRRPANPIFFASLEGAHSNLAGIADGEPTTRWSPGHGQQNGSEWVYMLLPTAQTIAGIDLQTHGFHTDFPRALRVSAFEACPTEASDVVLRKASAQTLIRIDDWHGGMGISRNGYPFFEPAHRGKLFFSAPITTRCLLIEQLGLSQHYDWSVAELGIAFSTQPSTPSESARN